MTSGAHMLCLVGPGACGGGQGPLSEQLLVGFSGQRPAIPPRTLHRPGRPREEGLSAQISGGACAEKAPYCPGASCGNHGGACAVGPHPGSRVPGPERAGSVPEASAVSYAPLCAFDAVQSCKRCTGEGPVTRAGHSQAGLPHGAAGAGSRATWLFCRAAHTWPPAARARLAVHSCPSPGLCATQGRGVSSWPGTRDWGHACPVCALHVPGLGGHAPLRNDSLRTPELRVCLTSGVIADSPSA